MGCISIGRDDFSLGGVPMAETVSSKYGTSEALPVEETMKILKKYKALNWNKKLYPWKR